MTYIQVMQEEKEAIERLTYFACEKYENLAATFLLQSGNTSD